MSSMGKSLTWTSKSMLYVRKCSLSIRGFDNSAPRSNCIVTREPVLVSSPIRSPTECLKVVKLRGKNYLFSYDGKKDWIEVSKFNKNVSVQVKPDTCETDCKACETESLDELKFHPDYNLPPGTQWADVCPTELDQNERAVTHAESTEFDIEYDVRYNLPPGALWADICIAELNSVEQKDQGEKPPLLDLIDLEIQFDPRFNLQPGTSWVDASAGGDYSEQADHANFHEDISVIGNHLLEARDSVEMIQEKSSHRKSVIREVAALASLWKTTKIATAHARPLKDSIAVSYPAVIDTTRSAENIAADSIATTDPLRWNDVCAGGDYCEQDGALSYETDLSESSDIGNTLLGSLDSAEMMQKRGAHRKSVIREVAALASLWKTSKIAKAHTRRLKDSTAVECCAALCSTRSQEGDATESSVALDTTRPVTGTSPRTLDSTRSCEQDNAAKFQKDIFVSSVSTLLGAWDSKAKMLEIDAHRKSVVRELAAMASLGKTPDNNTAHVRRVNICIPTTHAPRCTENIAAESPAAKELTRPTKYMATVSLIDSDKTSMTDVKAVEGSIVLNIMRSTQSIAPDNPTALDATRSAENIAAEILTSLDATRYTEDVVEESPAALNTTRSTESIAAEWQAAVDSTAFTENIAPESPTALDATRSTEGIDAEDPITLDATRSTENITLEIPAALDATIYTEGIYAEGSTTLDATRSEESLALICPAALVLASENPTSLDATRYTEDIALKSPTAHVATTAAESNAAEGATALDSTRSTDVIASESPAALKATRSAGSNDVKSLTAIDATRSTDVIGSESPAALDATRSIEGIGTEGTKLRGADWLIVQTKSTGGIVAENVTERPTAVGATRSTEVFASENPTTLDATSYTEDIALNSPTAHVATSPAESNAAEGATALDSTRSTEDIASESPAALNATRSAGNNDVKSSTAFDATRSAERVAEETNATLGATWPTENVASKSPIALVQPSFTGGIAAENVASHCKTISTRIAAECPAAVGATRSTEVLALEGPAGLDATRSTDSNIAKSSTTLDGTRYAESNAAKSPTALDATKSTENFPEETNATLYATTATEGIDAEGTKVLGATWSTENVAAKCHTALVQTKFTGAIVTENVAVHLKTKSRSIVTAERLSAKRKRDGIGGRVMRPTGKKVGKHLETSSPLVPCHSMTGNVKDTISSQGFTPVVKRFSNELPYTVIPYVHWSDICLHSCAIRSRGSRASVSPSDLNITRSTGEVTTDRAAGTFATRFTKGDAPESKSTLGTTKSTSGIGDRVIGCTRKKVGDIELSQRKASSNQFVSEKNTYSCEVPRPMIKTFNKLPYAVIPVVSWSDICLNPERALDGQSTCNISDNDGVVAVHDDNDGDQRHRFFFSKIPQVNPKFLSILVILLFFILFLYKVFFCVFF